MPRKRAGSATPPTTGADELTTWLQEHGIPDDTSVRIKEDLGATTVADLSALNEGDLKGVGMKPVQARKLLEAVKPAETAVGGGGLMSPVGLDDVLPSVPSDESWLNALRAGGVLKVEQSTVISAVRAALAHRAGLYEVPAALVAQMEKFADANEEQVDPAFFALRKQLTRRTYADVFEAIDGLDGTFVTEGRKKELFRRIDDGLWPAIIGFQSQIKGWQEAWLGAGNQMAMTTVLIAAAAGGGASLPPGIMQPPDTGGLRDYADGVADAVNKIFAGTGVQIVAALAYEAAKICETLQNSRLPAMIGAANRDQMLRQLRVAVPATYPRLETNLTRYVLAIMQLKDIPAGPEEIRYLSAMFMAGAQIPWEQLGATNGRAGVTGIGGKL